MRKQDVTYTVINIILSHFLISVFSGLVFGVTHPLSSMYVSGHPAAFVIVSLLMVMPLYMICGYLFILGKNSLYMMDKALAAACFYCGLFMLGAYAVCFVLVHYNIVSNAWMYYVLINYPNALIFNNISLKVDGQNLWFILTAVTAPLAFYLGAMVRYGYEKVKIKDE